VSFALFLLLLLVVTGLVWLLDKFVLRNKRSKEAKQPWWVEYSVSFFPVILAVFLLRSFLVEPFKIPSGSMIPTLQVGDFILVNKFTYGIRLPVIDLKVIPIGDPQRGDVMVFRYPSDPSVNYIKRVVGLPGDSIVYRDKKLFINNQLMPQAPAGDYTYSESGNHMIFAQRFREQIDGVEHDILLSEGQNPGILEFSVPEGHYFTMGDNRDRSNDSRYWGMVPEANVVGRAFLIWFSWDMTKGGVSWSRIGNNIQ